MFTDPREHTNTQPKEAEPKACHHCGEPCPNPPISNGLNSFCCVGCQTVYEILHENGLQKFYEIDPAAGQTQRQQKASRYAFLEDDSVVERLVDFSSPDMEKVTLLLPQIHCASCVWLLENLHRLEPAVRESRVHFPKKELYLTYDPQKTSLKSTAELLHRVGYPPEINLSNLDSGAKPGMNRRLIYQLGVAGFAFGNIMLLSFPEYLNLSQETYEFYFQTFAYLNLMLALPVVFFSGWDYLRSAWIGIRNKHLNIDVPVSLGILAIFGRSTYEILSQTGLGYLDSLAGLVFFLLVGKWFQQRTYYRLSFDRDYKSYFPIAAQRKTAGDWQSVSLDQLQPGDVLLIRHGELIPADSILLKGEGFVDYSFVTGESETVSQQTGDKLFAGGRQMGGPLEISLTKEVSQSYLTQLWNNDIFTKEKEGRAVRLADTIGTWFTFSILGIALLTFLWWAPQDIGIAFNATTAVLIIACPCAVALAIPFIFGNAIRLLARKGFFLKNPAVLEQLTRFNSVVLDKTGTLTRSKAGAVTFDGTPLTATEMDQLIALVHPSTHPLSRQIRDYCLSLSSDQQSLPIQGWEEQVGKGIEATVAGTCLRLGSASFVEGASMESNGQATTVFLAKDGVLRGTFHIQNTFREGLSQLVAYFQKQDISISLLTGDNDRQKSALEDQLGPEAKLLFQQAPQHKLDYVQDLQKHGREVLMLGDGLNDAGALSQSDCGLVLTEQNGSFTPASDGVLHADSFGLLSTFFRFAKASVRLVYLAYSLAFIYNVIGLSFAVQGALSPVIAAILMPLSSITIVVFGLLSSTWVAWRMKIL